MSRETKGRICLLLLIAFVVCAMWYVSGHWYQLMFIQGDSMEPSYHNLQLVVLNKYDRDYERGDVIAFECEGLSAVLVKRIAGIPGDRVVVSDERLHINDTVLEYYSNTFFENAGLLEDEIRLDEDEYIVIGDNVAESIDSRSDIVGIVKDTTVIGKVEEIW